jgi:hypothetical protein
MNRYFTAPDRGGPRLHRVERWSRAQSSSVRRRTV